MPGSGQLHRPPSTELRPAGSFQRVRRRTTGSYRQQRDGGRRTKGKVIIRAQLHPCRPQRMFSSDSKVRRNVMNRSRPERMPG